MKNRAIFILGLILIASLAFLMFRNRQTTKTAEQVAAENQADSDFLRAEMKVCSSKEQSDNCYRQAADIFMARWDYQRILTLLKDNEQYPEIFGRCHELTHYIGRAAFEQEKSVPKVYSQASPVCWGGFYHGVMESYFYDKHLSLTNPGSQQIAAALKTACGSSSDYAAPRFYSECIHGIGHAMMFITNTDLNKSLSLCDRLEGGQPTTCYGGVFMENSSSSTNTAHPTKFLNKADPMYPCNTLATRYLEVCYQYQSSYFAELSKWDWKKNADLCQQVPAAYRQGCFQIIGSNQVGFTQDYSKMRSNCDLMPTSNAVKICISGVVNGLSGRYVGQVNKISDFCGQLVPENKKNCYQELGSNISGWTSDPDKIKGFCAQLKNNEYIGWCLSGNGFDPSTQSFN